MTEVNINSNVRLSPHFSLGELTRSKSYPKIYNVPSHVAIENLKRVCVWLEVLREQWNRLYGEGDDGIIINSGYRSPELNRAVGGVATSNHLTGCAVDIRVAGKEQLLRYAVILLDYADRTHQDFDELILEHGKNGTIWLHFAVRPPGQHNRRKIGFLRG